MASSEELILVAKHLVAPGKGLLASDESTGTVGKRLEKHGLANTEDIRRSYREVLYTSDIGQYISGAILYKETLYQASSSGMPFTQLLSSKGVLPGIKVDEGLTPLAGGLPSETSTQGLDSLAAHCQEYVAAGAKFAKWRATLKVQQGGPSRAAVATNAEQLAQYAKICQECGLVPVVEPEVLIDGDHSIQRAQEVAEQVLAECTKEMWAKGVLLEAALLKPQMVIPGADFKGPRPSPQEVARHTLTALKRTVPAAIPGITFLSGGQTEEEATVNLNAINVMGSQVGGCPWALTFSYGRALQASVLKLWSADQSQADQARALLGQLARVNSEAAQGRYQGGPHPSTLSAESLREAFRGWQGGAPPS